MIRKKRRNEMNRWRRSWNRRWAKRRMRRRR